MSKHKKARETSPTRAPRHAKHEKKTTQTSFLETTGTISVSVGGLGFVHYPAAAEDIRIESNNLNGAFDKDIVTVRFSKNRGRFTGRVEAIVARGRSELVGTIEVENGTYFLVPDDRHFHADILLPFESVGDAIAKDKALVKIERYGGAFESPVGTVTRVLGKTGDKDAEMIAVALEKGFNDRYPAAPAQEAERIAETMRNIQPEELATRRDMRSIPTCTIDPADAKDFDDALSFRILDNGNMEIGVHIADVSHYVLPNTILDTEARERATSVYLADRTIPMLPFALSDDLCSLIPNTNKRTCSVVFELDAHGTIHDTWFGKTLIRSIHRFSYEEAQTIVTQKKGPFSTELVALNSLAEKIIAKNREAGAIDFDLPESKIELNADGTVKRIYRKERLAAHRLVEAFMLLANQAVARVIGKAHAKNKEEASLYRVHGSPNREKLADLALFMKSLGYMMSLDAEGGITPKGMQRALSQIVGKPEEAAIRTAALRAMAKAVYTTENIGHFGLSFDYYTHFTSPIRRYPDIVVHRTLMRHLQGLRIKKQDAQEYTQIAAHSTEREIAAAEAERATTKYFHALYMRGRINEEFEGTVTGVAEWGVFVAETATGCEGLIRLADLPADEWVHDEKHLRLVGKRTALILRIGDAVTARILAADPRAKTVDLAFVAKHEK